MPAAIVISHLSDSGVIGFQSSDIDAGLFAGQSTRGQAYQVRHIGGGVYVPYDPVAQSEKAQGPR